MARKVFISFLGTGDYKACVYTHENKESVVVRFVQTAIVELHCKLWTTDDQIIIFTTKEALKNWEQLQLEWQFNNISFKNVMIPSGANETELADMFDLVYNELQQNDELILDITHSLRSIPLITSSLLQYAKQLKQIRVQGIYYGAFEALGVPAYKIDEHFPNPADRKAPIFNLTYFSNILDWSNAANSFINFGSATELVNLTNLELKPILREAKGSNKVAKELKTLSKSIEELALILKTNRGLELIDGNKVKQINDLLSNLKQELIAPLNPILDQLKQSLQSLTCNTNNQNMIVAVQWCIDKQLIQEGFTLLQEGILTHLLGTEDYKTEVKRNFLSGYLSADGDSFDTTRYRLDDSEKTLIESRLNPESFADWKKIYKSLNETRNDINHAGIRENAIGAHRFECMLKTNFNKIKDLLNEDS